MRRTATASNSTRQGQLGAKRRRVAREPDDDSSKPAFREAGFRSKPGASFQNLQRFMAGRHAETQWPLKGADGFVRARSSGKTGAPFSHLPTGGRAGAR